LPESLATHPLPQAIRLRKRSGFYTQTVFRLGVTLAVIGAMIGLGGMAFAAFWIYTHLGA
jgi:hypothetical protein